MDRPFTDMGDDHNKEKASPSTGGESELETHPVTMPTRGMEVQGPDC